MCTCDFVFLNTFLFSIYGTHSNHNQKKTQNNHSQKWKKKQKTKKVKSFEWKIMKLVKNNRFHINPFKYQIQNVLNFFPHFHFHSMLSLKLFRYMLPAISFCNSVFNLPFRPAQTGEHVSFTLSLPIYNRHCHLHMRCPLDRSNKQKKKKANLLFQYIP